MCKPSLAQPDHSIPACVPWNNFFVLGQAAWSLVHVHRVPVPRCFPLHWYILISPHTGSYNTPAWSPSPMIMSLFFIMSLCSQIPWRSCVYWFHLCFQLSQIHFNWDFVPIVWGDHSYQSYHWSLIFTSCFSWPENCVCHSWLCSFSWLPGDMCF